MRAIFTAIDSVIQTVSHRSIYYSSQLHSSTLHCTTLHCIAQYLTLSGPTATPTPDPCLCPPLVDGVGAAEKESTCSHREEEGGEEELSVKLDST